MLNIPRHHIVPLCLCLLGAVSTARAVLNHHAGVFEPDAGVVCDRHSGFCADAQGGSLQETRRYLGRRAPALLQSSAGAQGHEDAFSLSDGRRCERSAQTCWRGRDHAVPDTGLTRHLYGSGI